MYMGSSRNLVASLMKLLKRYPIFWTFGKFWLCPKIGKNAGRPVIFLKNIKKLSKCAGSFNHFSVFP